MGSESVARLATSDGRRFDMLIVGYQYPAASGGPSPSSIVGMGDDDNWLRIGIDVKDAAVSWRSIDAALSFKEATQLSVVTQNLGRGEVTTIDFAGIEPCFALRATRVADGSIDTQLMFDVEMHPNSRHFTGDPHIMRLSLTGDELSAFGAQLEQQLRALPR